MRAAARLTAATALLLAVGAPAASAQDPVVGAAGDIACDPESRFFNDGLGVGTNCRQMDTSTALLAMDPAVVLPLGDEQYEDGELWKYQRSYDPSWGRLKAITRPAIGNHEYARDSGDPRGAGYFDYFNGPGNFSGPAGDRDKAYFSFDVGSWHLIALNSMCSEVDGCGPGSRQERWLREDLAAHQNECTLVYMHHPRFSSGQAGNYDSLQPLWQAAYAGGAELVLAGHDHVYERLAPQDAVGNRDAQFGIRSFIVGTGGKNLGRFPEVHPNSEVRDATTPGVLKLTLGQGEYQWQYVRDAGVPSGDSGSDTCHGRPPPREPEASTGRATSVRASSARLNAAVNGRELPTTYRFEYGPTTAYGRVTPELPLERADATPRQVSASLRRLRKGRVYHYRVVATNASGVVAGEDRTFRARKNVRRYARMVTGRRGLAAYWRLSDPGGEFGFDQEGRSLGVLERGFTTGQRGALKRDGNPAAAFDGRSGEMISYGPRLSRSATIEGWFLWRNGVALMRDDSFLGGWVLAYDLEGELLYRVADSSFRTGLAVGEVRDGQWHHVALTKSGDRVAWYLDGDLVDTSSGVRTEPATMPWHVMRNGPASEFSEGLADEVALYRRALPTRSIEHHYDAGKGRRLRRTTYFRPRGQGAVTGRTIRPKGALRRLFGNDGIRLRVRARRSGDQYVATTGVVGRIKGRPRRGLRRIAVHYNGATSSTAAGVALRVFNRRSGAWETVKERLPGTRIDRNLHFSARKRTRDYVSRSGRIRVRITGTADRPFNLNTDFVTFRVQY